MLYKNKAAVVSKADTYGVNEIVDLIRGVAIDSARNKIMDASITEITDNSTGTVADPVGAVTIPAPFTVTGTDASPKAGFDTAIGKLANASVSLADYLNKYLAPLGLPIINTNSAGTITAAIPALDKTLTAVTGSGGTAVEVVSAAAQLNIARNNLATLAVAVNDIAVALGFDEIVDGSGGSASDTRTLTASAATSSGVTGADANTMSDTAVDAALTALASGIASLAAHINFVLSPGVTGNLTDNSGGTASTATPRVIAAMTLPDAHTDGGTDSAPKAAFDTEVQKIENNMSDLVAKINILAEAAEGINLLTDSTGVTPDTTLEVIDFTLTAVDGTSNNAIDYTTGLAQMTLMRNNMATIIAKVNELAPIYGIQPLTDNSGGTAQEDETIDALSTTGTGSDGTSDGTMSDAQVDAFLASLTNAFATIADQLDAMDDVGEATRPLKVVAGR